MNEQQFDKFSYINALDGADLTLAEFRVLIAVWRHSDRHGRHAYASAARLSQECRMHERNVRRYLAELCRKKFLRRVQRGGRDTQARASEYELRLPDNMSQPATDGQLDESQPGDHYPVGDESQPGNSRHPNRVIHDSQPGSGDTPTELEQSREQKKSLARTNKGTQLPDNWSPTPELVARLRAKHPHIDIDHEVEQFTNYWHAESGQKASKRNWNAALRVWMGNAAKWAPRNGQRPPRSTSDALVAQTQALKHQPPRQELP
jgi:hypothetical protein